MPKINTKKRKSISNGPYTKPATSTPTSNPIFKMSTDLGQHVLKNPGVADAIVQKADLKQSDTVLEVGPGTGNLTIRILERAKKCIAVEYDARMAAEVTKRVQGTPAQKRLEVLLGDVIKTDISRYHFDVCISNTPYQISSPLVFKILGMSHPPRVAILMFQREFAMRLTAKPGDKLYSRLSVNVQMFAKCEHIMKVGRNNFRPPPQVESSVVRLVPKNPKPSISFDEFDGILRVCFVRKNKTLRSSFLGVTSVMEMLESNYRTWCAQQGIALDDGPSEMDVDEGASPDQPEEQDDDAGMMDVDDAEDVPEFMREELMGKKKKGGKRKKKGKVYELVYEKTRKILEDDLKLAEKRSRMCDEGDFLKLLYAFNQEGIHFA